eukprot:1190975-Heterocapsa_arctica.AAC.2
MPPDSSKGSLGRELGDETAGEPRADARIVHDCSGGIGDELAQNSKGSMLSCRGSLGQGGPYRVIHVCHEITHVFDLGNGPGGSREFLCN